MTEIALDRPPSWQEAAATSPRRAAPPQAAGRSRRASGLAVGIAVSLALHGVLALGWMSASRFRPAPPRLDQLQMDLLGMVSNRQAEQKLRGEDSAPESPRPPAPPRETRAPRPKPAEASAKVEKPVPPAPSAPSPVKVATLQEPDEQRQASPPSPPANEPAAVRGVEEQQVQQTVATPVSEATIMRAYLSGLKKTIQGRLTYPAEARESRHTGSPKIRFVITESGDILAGSLAIHESSGHALLDEAALRAARDSTPMAKPPRQMSVVIAVSFLQER